MHDPRILVVRGGAIGDFIMTLPAIGALRERWPAAHIEVLGYPHITELALDRRYADASRTIEARAMVGFFIPNGVLAPELMEYFASFQLVVSYLFDPDEVVAANVRRCGVKHYLQCSPRPTDRHAAAHYCQPLESLAIFVAEPQPRVFPSAESRLAAERFWAGASREGVAVIHPGSGSPKKNWDVRKFGEISKWLVDEWDAKLLVVEGEADVREVAELVRYLAPRKFRVVRGLRLMELAAVLEQARVYVGNDSGITHLAAAVGVPTVALFGSHSSSIWEPPGDHVRVISFSEKDIEQVRRAVGEWWNRGGSC